jgi:adenine deaminase
MRNLKRIHDAGVTVAASTDAGNIGTLHASSLYDEALQMVASGLSPKEVLRTATVGGAAMMGRLHDLGTIQDGKLADLVVLERNPLEDIGAIASAKFVVKDGHVFDSATILREPPAQIVQRLVNAYNVHDPAIIAEVLAADASFAAAGISPLRSRADIASYHRDLFAQNPALHIEVLGRQTDADTVTDRAIVSGWSDGRQTAESTLMYRVRDREVTSVAVT